MPKIAIISDTHDQIAHLRAAVRYCNAEQIDLIIHCGDLISPFMLNELAVFTGVSHLVYGNNTGDQHLISSRCTNDYPTIHHHGILGTITFNELRIAFVHYPEIAMGLAMQSTYDIVCCGHNHRSDVSYYDHTLLINPGHMLGENEETGFTILDCNTMITQRIKVGECMFNTPVRVSPEPFALHGLQEVINR